MIRFIFDLKIGTGEDFYLVSKNERIDKDVELEVVIKQAQRIKDLLRIKVGYIHDKNDLLEGKESPTDKGRKIFCSLVNDAVFL